MLIVLNQKLGRIILALLLLLFFVFFFSLDTPFTLANASNLSQGGGGLAIPSGNVQVSSSIARGSLADNVVSIVNYFIGFLGFVATLVFIYAGALWILGGGSDDSVSKAKKTMTYAVIGIIVILLSYSIVQFVSNSLGGAPGSGGSSTGVQCGNAVCANGQTCAFDSSNQPVCRDLPTRNTGNVAQGAVKSGPSAPVVNQNLDKVDALTQGLQSDLSIAAMSKKARESAGNALAGGDISRKIDQVKNIIRNPDQFGVNESDLAIFNNLLNGLERLELLRDEMNDLRKNMPESDLLIQSYDETSLALDHLMDDPTSTVKYSRFQSKYQDLKKLIREFPVITAAITATPGEGNAPFTVQFDGLNSNDPTGGSIGSYRWTYIDKNGSEVVMGTDPVITYEFTEPNTYNVRLSASTAQKDTAGYRTAADGTSIVRIKVNPPTSSVDFKINGRPVREIATFTLAEGQAGLAFDPSSTTAALGRQIQNYEWSYGDNTTEFRQVPSTVVHTYNQPGEYFVRLVVTDNLQIKDRKIVKLFIKSLAANISLSPEKGDVNTEFRLSGVGSRSDDGVITDFDWEIRNSKGQVIFTGQENNFTYQFDRPGDYQVSLTVTDITGAKDQQIQTLKIQSREPVANFETSIPKNNHPSQIQFNAINSYDPDEGDQIEYYWDFDGDGQFEITKGTDAVVSHEYKKVGEYRVRLEVRDQFGETDFIEKPVTVDSILSADIKLNKTAVRVGDPVIMEVENSNAVSYLWEFGDGSTESTDDLKVEHTYDRTGQFNVKLNFFDAQDNDNFDTRRILVGAADEPLAIINLDVNGQDPIFIDDLCGANQDGILVSRSDRIRFDGKGSINTDGTGRLLSYAWAFPEGEKSGDRDPLYRFNEVNQEGKCFEVELQVRDQVSGSISSKDSVYFKVINRLPEITDFTITPLADDDEFLTPLLVKLRVVNPRDEDGLIKRYRWWYTREGSPNQRLGIHTTTTPETEMTITSFGQPNLQNRYFFTVEVIDDDKGLYRSDEQFGPLSFLEVRNGPNLSPVAEFSVDKTTISVGDSISFFSKAYDPQGEALPNSAFRWDFDGDGAFDDTTSGPQVNRQYNTPGEYMVRLNVVNRGLSSSVVRKIFVEPTESLPQPAFTYKVDGNTVSFDGSLTRFDPTLTDKNLRFEWDFNADQDANGNGQNDDDAESSEIRPTFTYSQIGRYRVRLKVIDSQGTEGVVVRTIDLAQSEAERLKNAEKTLRVSSLNHPITTLDLELIPGNLLAGGSADVVARVLNADGSVYTGKVYFEVIEGTGQFFPNPTEAKDSIARSIFNSVDPGRVRIRVKATDTLYGDLIETATFEVK